ALEDTSKEVRALFLKLISVKFIRSETFIEVKPEQPIPLTTCKAVQLDKSKLVIPVFQLIISPGIFVKASMPVKSVIPLLLIFKVTECALAAAVNTCPSKMGLVSIPAFINCCSKLVSGTAVY